MAAPTAGSWSYLAWISACALAAVKSGADLQPVNSNPAPRSATVPKPLRFAAIFTFPPYTAPSGPKLVRPAIFLLVSSAVNGVVRDRAHACRIDLRSGHVFAIGRTPAITRE